MYKATLLIPAFNPNDDLLDLVDQLLRLGFQHVVVVNDGSEPRCAPIFDALSRKCVVLTKQMLATHRLYDDQGPVSFAYYPKIGS